METRADQGKRYLRSDSRQKWSWAGHVEEEKITDGTKG